MAVQTTTAISLSPRDSHIHLIGRDNCLPVKYTKRRVVGKNPFNWPTKYQRVPAHRPVNKHLDPAERPNGASTGEWVFVNVMLNGVRLNSLFVTTYENTLGKWYPGLTRYRIGGEW